MDFNAQQMREDALLKDGRYKYVVLDAREKVASSNNEMINLKLSLEVNGRRVVQWDSLILTPKMFWKVEHFCKSAGIPEKIEEGRLTGSDCYAKEGWVDITSKPNKDTGELENVVKDYVKPDNVTLDDDIPM